MSKIILISLFLALFSCSKSDKEIINWGWKLAEIRINKNTTHQSDHNIVSGMDVLDFRSGIELKDDTIYRGKIALAYIIDYIPNTVSCRSKQLKVIYIATGDTISYIAKWKN